MSTTGLSDSTPLPADRLAELERTCLVIMPFGEKPAGDRKVDFNTIYRAIFKPAIEEVKTPEGKPLIRRAQTPTGFRKRRGLAKAGAPRRLELILQAVVAPLQSIAVARQIALRARALSATA